MSTPSKVGSWSHWLLAVRPKTLFAAIIPVAIGLAVAARFGSVCWLSAVLTLLCAILIQIGTNFANDYWDWRKGADDEHRLGPVRVTSAGLISPKIMLRATCLVFAVAALVGCFLISWGGWPILVIGLLSIICGFLYTAGPFPLAYLGLGEVFVMVFFGLVATAGTFYLQTLTWPWWIWWIGVAPGSYSMALIVVNNLRDRKNDQRANKKTLAVRLGPGFSRGLYLWGIWGPAVVCLSLGGQPFAPSLFFVPALVAAALAIPLSRAIFMLPESAALNSLLAATGKAALLFTGSFILVWVLAG